MTGKLLTYLKVHKAKTALAILLATGTILAGIGLMTSSGYLISRAAERPMLVDLFMVTAAVRFFGISRAVIRYFERVVSHDLTFRILLQIRTTFYNKLNSFSQKWMMAKRPGELLTAMISDIETLQNVYLRILSPVIVALVICSITFSFLMFIDSALAMAVLVIFIVNGLLLPWLAVQIARGTGKTDRDAQGRMKVYLVEKIQGIQDALWLENQQSILKGFEKIQGNIDGVQQKHASTSGLVEGLGSLLANLAVFTVLILAIPLILGGHLQAVWLAALVLGVFSSFEALQGLPNAYIRYESFKESSQSLNNLTKAEDSTHTVQKTETKKEAKVINTTNNKTIHALSGHSQISFHQVSFSYDQDHEVLKDIEFELSPGSKTAIVGPTGSGKSTIINLLTGFWKPTTGNILADDLFVKDLDMKSYRSLLGVVSQDTYIFNRSVRENLLIADSKANDQTLRAVLSKGSLDMLSDRLDHVLGSQGMKLSGGERQLFALARALLRESRIWVFDELSANMDVGTERKILDILWSTLGDRTLLSVTHRLLDMDKMDQILVLDSGKIIERGSHQELLAANGFYAKMYAQQMEVLRD
jgi:ATP-binding cassette, subfamily C, bacterial CydC